VAAAESADVLAPAADVDAAWAAEEAEEAAVAAVCAYVSMLVSCEDKPVICVDKAVRASLTAVWIAVSWVFMDGKPVLELVTYVFRVPIAVEISSSLSKITFAS
jgi:hypothetical protein